MAMDISNAEFTTVFNFATEQGKTIVYLHYFTLAVCVLVGIIVTSLLIAAVVKFRQRPGDSEPVQNPGNSKLEITWTALTALVLFTLGVLTALVMHMVNPEVMATQPDVIVNAHQWWWEYRYPKSGAVTANELYLPAGVNSLLEITSDDVVHSFWVPAFGEKMDAIPGHPNYLNLKPLRPGLFLGTCSEFCGADHSLMRIIARVVTPQQFNQWVQDQAKAPVASSDAGAQHGEQLFMSHTCMECHSISGTKAHGQVAPDLSHVATRSTIGSGVIANNLDNLTRWIMNPQKIKPGCHMPDMRLSQQDAHDIAAYLENLK